MRTLRSLALVALVGAALALVLLRAPSEGPTTPEGALEPVGPDAGATLRGTASPRPDGVAAPQTAGEHLAARLAVLPMDPSLRARIVDPGATDEDAARGLVEFLRPAHDLQREVPPPLGSMRSGGDGGLTWLCGTIQARGEAGLGALIAALADEDGALRRRAAACLARIGDAAAIPALVARIEAGFEDDREAADFFRALTSFGSAARDALPAYHAWLRDPRRADEARAEAAAGLFRVARPAAEAFETAGIALEDPSFAVRLALTSEIADLGPAALPLLPTLVRLLQDDRTDLRVRRQVLRAIGAIGPPAAGAGGVLLRIATDDGQKDPQRVEAVRALVQLGPEAIPPLLVWAEGADDDARLLVVRALDADHRPPFVDPARLLAILDPLRASPWPEDFQGAMAVGAGTGSPPAEIVPWLGRWFDEGAPEARCTAIVFLCRYPEASDLVLPYLLRALEDENVDVKRRAIEALVAWLEDDEFDARRLATPEVVDRCVARLVDPDWPLRTWAAELVHRLAPERDAEALSVWVERLEAGHWLGETCAVLAGLGPAAEAAIPALEAAKERWKQPRLQRLLEETLAAVRPKEQPAPR